MIRVFLLLLAFATPVHSEPARVLSGEHADFTRLVIELPGSTDWTVGRIPGGYGFASKTGTQPTYDLSSVWQRIPRSRLASLGIDPTTGALSLGLGCDCHVFPFEYGNGIVVLDIKEGPPPAGSAFETAFIPPGADSPITSETASYDWILDHKSGRPKAPVALPLPLDTGTVSLEPLRDELLEQIAHGAADGVVDMELPGKPGKIPVTDHGELPWSHIRIGEQPGVIVTAPGSLIPKDGSDPLCTPDQLLDLPNWGEGRTPQDLLAETRDGLFGEFDVPDEQAVLRSVRQLLYLGFGVEALQHADLLDTRTAGDALPLYRSMARLLDGETDPQTPFARMLECDGPAAFWAALAHDRLPTGPGVNRDAILQAYQALPPHLRRHLGPGLADRFLAHDDPEAARVIRDAMERAPDADRGSVALLDAKAELHEGNVDAARTHAEAAVALDADRADSLVALVETHFRKLQPMDPGVSDALLGLRSEVDATSLGPEVDRAIALSLALSDRIDAAFAEEVPPPALTDLWQVVEARAADDAFLMKAVLATDAPRPDISPDVGRAVAERLISLKFPDAALVWLGPVTPADLPGLRLVAATAELDRGNARSTVALLSGLEEPAAKDLRARALIQLGDLPAASETLAAAGDQKAAIRADLWRGEWSDLGSAAPEAWRQAADQDQPVAVPTNSGLLGIGDKTIDASLASREAIEALLASVPSPSGD
jgi:hypothetical protein